MNTHLPDATKREMAKTTATLQVWAESHEEAKDPYCLCPVPRTDGGTFCFYCGKHTKPK